MGSTNCKSRHAVVQDWMAMRNLADTGRLRPTPEGNSFCAFHYGITCSPDCPVKQVTGLDHCEGSPIPAAVKAFYAQMIVARKREWEMECAKKASRAWEVAADAAIAWLKVLVIEGDMWSEYDG